MTKDTFKGFNENPQSLNLYAYANGNPVTNVDPDGHVAIAIGAVVSVVYYALWAALLAIGASWVLDTLVNMNWIGYNYHSYYHVGESTMLETLKKKNWQELWLSMSESRIMILTKLKAGTFMTIIHIWKRMVWNCIGPVKSSYIENTKKNYHYTIRMWLWPWYFPKYR